MKRPSWATAVGVFLIVFGSWSILANVATIYIMPHIATFTDMTVQVAKDAVDEIEIESGQSPKVTVEVENPETTVKDDNVTVRSKSDNPDYNVTVEAPIPEETVREIKESIKSEIEIIASEGSFDKYYIYNSIILISIAALFIVAGILMLMNNNLAVIAALSVLIISIAYNVGARVIGMFELSIISLLIDLILLVVILVSDKTSFRAPKVQEL